MRARRASSLIVGLVLCVAAVSAQEVLRYPGQNAALEDRWNWASREGVRVADGRDFWIGYSIKRLMSEGSFINSGTFVDGGWEHSRNLYDIISGDSAGHAPMRWTSDGGDKSNILRVIKEVSVLLMFSGDPNENGSLKRVELSSMELCVNLQHKTLMWLGSADDDQSVSLLKEQFDRRVPAAVRKELVTAIGIHQNGAAVFGILRNVLKNDEADDVRSQAAFWLSQQGKPDGLTVLLEAAENDRSQRVKEQAVFAVSQLQTEESLDALIALAKSARDSKVRGKAAFWLGQRASQKAISTLESILTDDDQTEVQRQALYALAQIHTPDGVDRLIKIARTHPNPRIRKQAIQCLGQTDDPKAVDALIAIVRH